MAGRGRPPAPPSKAAQPAQTPTGSAKRGRPERPPHLSPDAAAKWDEIIPILEGMGVLTLADAGILATYCSAWSDYLAARRAIDRDGVTVQCATGAIKAHPAFGIQTKAWDALRLIGAQLGLTPDGRARLRIQPEAPADARGKSKFFKE